MIFVAVVCGCMLWGIARVALGGSFAIDQTCQGLVMVTEKRVGAAVISARASTQQSPLRVCVHTPMPASTRLHHHQCSLRPTTFDTHLTNTTISTTHAHHSTNMAHNKHTHIGLLDHHRPQRLAQPGGSGGYRAPLPCPAAAAAPPQAGPGLSQRRRRRRLAVRLEPPLRRRGRIGRRAS